MDSNKLVESLQAKLSRCKKSIKDKLGEGIWGLNRKEDNKFTHEEIVFLFARIFSTLGFECVQKVRQEFPDCICYRDGKEVGVEFEPYLSSFRTHLQDDLNLCQCIICWEDDLKIYDSLMDEIREKNIEVIELKKLYEEHKISDRFSSKTVITQSDIKKLSQNQLNVLKTFIDHGKDILTKKEISEGIGISGKGLGGALKGFAELQKKRIDWVVKQTPNRDWEINPKHIPNIISALKWHNLI